MVEHIQRWAPTLVTTLCVGLAGIVWLPLNQDAAVTPAAATGNFIEQGTQSATDTLANGAQNLLERPLFHVTRRPPEEAQAVQIEPVQITLTLTGVLNNEDVQIALLRLSNSPELLRRREGEQVGDWRILDISQSSITVLTADGQEQVIGLSSAIP
jgi:hypothetical protein